jgi:putative transposase
MIAFIEDHRGADGVEPISKVLPIAPSTYFDHQDKQAGPAKLSARARRDAALRLQINRLQRQSQGLLRPQGVAPDEPGGRIRGALYGRAAHACHGTARGHSREDGQDHDARQGRSLPIGSCRIVGWRISRAPHASLMLDALEQALPERRPVSRCGLVHHSDRGSQYVSIKYSEQLAEDDRAFHRRRWWQL